MSLEQALAFTLREEGGYVDDPRDGGGATNRGITQAVYDAWRSERDLGSLSVMLLSDGEARQIYEQRYWGLGHCGDLPAALGVIHFDWCVNRGIRGAIATMQAAVGRQRTASGDLRRRGPRAEQMTVLASVTTNCGANGTGSGWWRSLTRRLSSKAGWGGWTGWMDMWRD